MMRLRDGLIGGMMLALLVAGALLSTQLTHAQDNFGSNWQAEYYATSDLSGGTVLIRTEPQLDLNFGTGSPGPEVPVDNFSARFTTTENFPAGAYEFVAQVDDGVRVQVGSSVLINQFQANSGTFTGRIVFDEAGERDIRVDYREGGGTASLRVFWREAGPPPTPTPVPIPPGALRGTVIRAAALVVRDAPFLGANRVGTVRRGEQFAVVGRDPDARWFLVDGGGVQGWTWGYYLFIDGNEFSVPVSPPFTTRGAPAANTWLRGADDGRVKAAGGAEREFRADWADWLGRQAAGDWTL